MIPLTSSFSKSFQLFQFLAFPYKFQNQLVSYLLKNNNNKRAVGIFIRIVFNLQMTLEKTDIFITLGPSKHEHSTSPFIKIFHSHFGGSFSAKRYYTCFLIFIHMYFIFEQYCKWYYCKFLISNCTLVYRNTIGFSEFTSHSMISLNSLISSKSCFYKFLGIFYLDNHVVCK